VGVPPPAEGTGAGDDVRAAVLTGFGFGGVGVIVASTGAFGGRCAFGFFRSGVFAGAAFAWAFGAPVTLGGGGATDRILGAFGGGGTEVDTNRGLLGGFATGGLAVAILGDTGWTRAGLAIGRGASLRVFKESDPVPRLAPRNGNLPSVARAYGNKPGRSNSGKVETGGRLSKTLRSTSTLGPP
jgi:hypothetical protein